MLGVLVNAVAVVVGSLLGLLLKKGIPARVEKGVMAALGLCCAVIGIQGALDELDALL